MKSIRFIVSGEFNDDNNTNNALNKSKFGCENQSKVRK